MNETPKNCSDCGKCAMYSKECLECPNFKFVELLLQKTVDVFCAAVTKLLDEICRLLPPILTEIANVATQYMMVAEKVRILPHPRPDYKKKPKKYEAPLRRFIHHDRGRR